MSLPIVDLSGTPFDQGLTHGRSLAPRIRHNVDLYFERFRREVGLDRPAVREIASVYADAIRRANAGYFSEMEGVAEGCGIDFIDIAALNVRYEILYYQFGKIALELQARRERGELPPGYEIDGCTAFALLPEATASGHLTIGQNWDWIPEVQGGVLRRDVDGHRSLGYTEAGIVGIKIGLNSAGIGLAINGMTTTEDDWSRLAKPFHVRCYEILQARTFEEAAGVITDEPRSCSTNFLIAQTPDRVADLEAAPDKVNVLSCRDGCLTHANHFVDPDALGIVEPPNDRRIFSRRREERLRERLLAAVPVTVDAIQAALRDTTDDPFGLCRHRDPNVGPEEHYTTVTAVIMDLETKTLHLTDGAPDESEFETVTL
ncbi:MAG: C45 family peptidase [Capsulimonadales bacterium]|nr:C45 family peptidase [Capsulimonadales bacterium]